MSLETGHFIIGITNNNNKFRPSDWAERLASTCGHFDARGRLQYNPMLRPARHDGKYGLFVASKLNALNPDAYYYAMDFACRNHLQIIDIGMHETMPDAA